MYHSISVNAKDPNSLDPGIFETQMRELSQHRPRIVRLTKAIHDIHHWTKVAGKIAITFDDAYADFMTIAVPILRKLNLPCTLFVPVGCVGGTAVWDTFDKTKRLLDWNELSEAGRNNVDIASHGMFHVQLPKCDKAGLTMELQESLAMLKNRLGRVEPLFSYPGGHFGGREMDAAQHAGYIAAFGVASKRPNTPVSRVFALHRCRWEHMGFR